MEFLNEEFLGNTAGAWGLAGLVCVLTVIVLSAVKRPLLKSMRRFSDSTDTLLDDMLAAIVDRTKTWFLVVIGLYFGSLLLKLPATADAVLETAIVLVLLLQGGIWGNQVILWLLGRSMKRRLADDASAVTTLAAITLLTKIALWAVVLLLALDNVGVDITALVAGLGVGGIAVALAAQSVLSDLFASMAIVFDKPFVLGDFIVIGDMAGTVEHVGMKTTRVRSLSGEQLVFSNARLLSSDIRNFKRMQERRIVFTVGVTYETPKEKLERIPAIVRGIVESHEKTRFDRCHFKTFGAFSLDYEIVYYVLEPDYTLYMDLQQSMNLAIFGAFADEGIEFAYPTQTLYQIQR